MSPRKEAIAAASTRYFTGKPCKRGHVAERMVSTLTCVMCKLERERRLYRKDPDAAIAKVKVWQDKNRARHNARAVRYQMERRKADPFFAIKVRAKIMVANALRRRGFTKKSKTAAILGCGWPEFILHIERQFVRGMTWENRDRWHIDHIVPLSTAKTEADVLALNHFTNLRPLWAPENIAKGDAQTHLI